MTGCMEKLGGGRVKQELPVESNNIAGTTQKAFRLFLISILCEGVVPFN